MPKIATQLTRIHLASALAVLALFTLPVSGQQNTNLGYENVPPARTPNPDKNIPPISRVDLTADQHDFRVKSVTRPPDGFIGNLAYDRESGRLWLISFGPPANTRGSSTLYEYDLESGKVLAQAKMPFVGEFAAPVYIDGFLYLGVPFESKLYKIVAGDRANLGQIVKTIPLPTLVDLSPLGEDVYRFPFIEFRAATVTPDKNILIHASALGEFITLDEETGKVISRVKTLNGVDGIAGVPDMSDGFLVLSNVDPADASLRKEMRTFLFRSAHGVIPPSTRRPDEKAILWSLLDAKTGNALASIERPKSATYASSTAYVKHEAVPGAPYGRFTFLLASEDEILTLEWTPRSGAPH